jgi:hypothetical protein
MEEPNPQVFLLSAHEPAWWTEAITATCLSTYGVCAAGTQSTEPFSNSTGREDGSPVFHLYYWTATDALVAERKDTMPLYM